MFFFFFIHFEGGLDLPPACPDLKINIIKTCLAYSGGEAYLIIFAGMQDLAEDLQTL